MSNSYTDVKNIALRVAPKGAHARGPAVLVNAHYDSTVGTPGASYCASCVGVGLEMVHAVVHNASLELAGPLILVLNGAEETFMQAAHGFLQHPWSSQVGAVINLESTGSGGPDLVFRMRGALPVRAYAESAPRPHATVAGQDLFATGLIPADTDFYVFAHPEYGNWPGIDVATILDGEAYHTNRDVPERIWPGSLQSLGENMLPTALRMAQLLQQERKGGEGGKRPHGRRPLQHGPGHLLLGPERLHCALLTRSGPPAAPPAVPPGPGGAASVWHWPLAARCGGCQAACGRPPRRRLLRCSRSPCGRPPRRR